MEYRLDLNEILYFDICFNVDFKIINIDGENTLGG